MTGSISAIRNGDYNAGLYSSYNPSMLAAMGGYGSMYNPMMSGLGGYNTINPMMGSMGMMGMYNPTFMAQQTEMIKQMYSAQNEIQKMNLEQQTNLHTAKEQAQVHNTAVHDRAFFETVAVNGDVQSGIRAIYDAIRRGDMDNVAQKYFELKQEILNKFGDHFTTSVSGLNDKENIDNYISVLYSEIAGGYNPGTPKPDLRTDILTYGENPFEHGLHTTFMGNSGHNELTAEECLNQIYGSGYRINDQGCKDIAHKWGERAGKAKEFGIYTGGGVAAGLTAWGLGRIFPLKMVSNIFKGKAKPLAWLGALAGAGYDLWWQMSRA